MKHWLIEAIAILLCISAHSLTYAEVSADDITYDWLTSSPASLGYITHFNKIFKLMKVRTFLEFGLGYETKYFLDSCSKVISVEFITHGYGPGPLEKFLNLYQECHNWIPIGFFSGYQGGYPYWAPYKYMASEHVYKACSYQTATHKNYALIDDFYRKELEAFINSLIKCHKIDIAFVHPILYLRSDLIELLFSKVPVIVACDTQCRAEGCPDDVFGYYRLACPEDYEEIFLSGHPGITVWVKKKEPYIHFALELKKYSER